MPRSMLTHMGLAAILAVATAGSGMGQSSDVSVTIEEWEVPTPKSRPHDPAVAPDGSA